MVKKVIEKVYAQVGADALVTCAEDLRFYVTGFESSFGVVITDADGTRFLTDPRYLEAAQNKLEGSGVTVEQYPSGVKLTELLKKYASIGVPFDKITANEYNSLVGAGYKLIDSTAAFTKAMSVKTESEISAISLACEATDKAYLKLLPEIKEGMTENEVAALLEYYMRTFGASRTSFDTICAFGANASVPHHETGNTRLKFGDPILIDFGCKINGYCSDCTRTFLFGDDKKHEDFKQIYKRVLEAQTLVKEKFTAGMTGREGDAIARGYLAQFNLDKYFTHSLGHSIGINIHELPGLSPRDNTVFCEGMVFSDEPGVYIAGKLGVRIEDTVTLKNGKVLSLTKTDKNLIIL